jgi:nucleotide-binding universal stress UspA family protein
MEIRSILAAMDLDEPAIAAARWARTQIAPAARVTLLHVIERPGRPRFSERYLPPPEDIQAMACEYATMRLRGIVDEQFGGNASIETRVGEPHEQVAVVARELGAELVVIGPHGNRPRPVKFLGTTAERVVRTCPVPVLVGTNPPDGPPRNILVPVDDDAVKAQVLRWARALADRFNADVELLHVWSNAVYSHVASMSLVSAANEEEARAQIRAELTDAADYWLEEMGRMGIGREGVRATVLHGKPGEKIVEAAGDLAADLILLGRGGSGLVAPALLGSTVGTVLHGARRPVLVVPNVQTD